MIAFDSNVFIYWLEANPEFYEAAFTVLSPVLSGQVRGFASTIVLAEILGEISDTGITQTLFSIPKLVWRPVDAPCALLARHLRLSKKLKTVDAIHLANAIGCGATSFYTNDQQLIRLGKVNKLNIKPLINSKQK